MDYGERWTLTLYFVMLWALRAVRDALRGDEDCPLGLPPSAINHKDIYVAVEYVTSLIAIRVYLKRSKPVGKCRDIITPLRTIISLSSLILSLPWPTSTRTISLLPTSHFPRARKSRPSVCILPYLTHFRP
jgi:hypothetical protein